MQGSIKIEAGEKELTDVTTSMKKLRTIHRKDRDAGSRRGRQRRRGESHELKKDG